MAAKQSRFRSIIVTSCLLVNDNIMLKRGKKYTIIILLLLLSRCLYRSTSTRIMNMQSDGKNNTEQYLYTINDSVNLLFCSQEPEILSLLVPKHVAVAYRPCCK